MRMGLSQRRLASKLGIDPGTIGHWERSRHQPLKKYIEMIERIFGEPIFGE